MKIGRLELIIGTLAIALGLGGIGNFACRRNYLNYFHSSTAGNVQESKKGLSNNARAETFTQHADNYFVPNIVNQKGLSTTEDRGIAELLYMTKSISTDPDINYLHDTLTLLAANAKLEGKCDYEGPKVLSARFGFEKSPIKGNINFYPDKYQIYIISEAIDEGDPNPDIDKRKHDIIYLQIEASVSNGKITNFKGSVDLSPKDKFKGNGEMGCAYESMGDQIKLRGYVLENNKQSPDNSKYRTTFTVNKSITERFLNPYYHWLSFLQHNCNPKDIAPYSE